MHNVILAVLLTAFVSGIATAYYFEYKIRKASAQKRKDLPTALELAYKRGVETGYAAALEVVKALNETAPKQ